ncbi:ABC transporter substrate-binding protein, partial [Micromonospora sp. DH15]|nr:ABC transporter substrate-binding protein [Micromonospora sp. DH15]
MPAGRPAGAPHPQPGQTFHLPAPWLTVDRSVVSVALVYPMRGPAGMFGPTCELCAQLAMEEINRAGGVLGKKIVPVGEDGASDWPTFAEKAEKLISED